MQWNQDEKRFWEKQSKYHYLASDINGVSAPVFIQSVINNWQHSESSVPPGLEVFTNKRRCSIQSAHNSLPPRHRPVFLQQPGIPTEVTSSVQALCSASCEDHILVQIMIFLKQEHLTALRGFGDELPFFISQWVVLFEIIWKT